MPKRLSKKPRKTSPSDPNVTAFRVLQQTTARAEAPQRASVVPLRRAKNPAAVALGRKGGQRSAAARLEKIDPAERSRIAAHAARERWKKEKGDD